MATANKKSAKKPEQKPAPAAKPAVKSATPAKKASAPAKPAAPAKKAAPASKPAPVSAAKPAAKKTVSKTVAKAAPAKPAGKAPAKKVAAPTPAPAKKVAPAKAAVKPATPAKPIPKPAAKPAKPAAAATKVASKAMPATSKTSAPAKKPAAKKAAASKAPAGLLTEAELLKMSDKDYMNEAQLEFFRHRLMTMKEEILVNARETGEHLKENEVFADPNDRATVEEENMLEQRVRDRERKLLKKIDSALRRIEAGEYGYCLETGDPIGVPRLLARPTAELSIEAQEKHERLEKLFAD